MKGDRKNIILILGSGFGGLACAKKLQALFKKEPSLRQAWQVILIDKKDYHLYTPPLYEIATALEGKVKPPQLKKTVALPFNQILQKNQFIKFEKRTVLKIDLNQKIVFFNDNQKIRFKILVIALGTQTNFYNIPGLKERAFGLKTLADAISIREQIKKNLLKEKLNIIIGGGGSTGVEFAGELAHWLNKQKTYYHQRLITIFEAAPTILPGFEKKVIEKATQRLKNFGVKIKTQSLITKITNQKIYYQQKEKIFPQNYDILVWAGGIKAPEVLTSLPLRKDKTNRIVCRNYSLEVIPNVYVIGDVAHLSYPGTKKSLPATATIAIKEASIAAENILASILTKPKKEFHPSANIPYIIPVGGKWAVAKISPLIFFGFKSWLLKQMVELWYYLKILPNFLAIKIWLKSVWLFSRND